MTWTYPSRNAPGPPGGFDFPDDAFFVRHGSAIISNQEENDTIVEIGFPSGRILFSYGHPRHPGGGPGLLEQPRRCLPAPQRRHHRRGPDELPGLGAGIPGPRLSSTRSARPAMATTGRRTLCASSIGDTPLSNGNLLVSEISGSWIDEYTTSGRLVGTIQRLIGYPSRPPADGARPVPRG